MRTIKNDSFKILIVTEAINFRNNLASKLRIANFEVEFATSAFHLLHLLENEFEPFQMVIINEDMHDMSAREMIALVRLAKSKKQLPILFISKSNDEEDIYELVLNGANEYVVQTANFIPILERAHKYLNIFKTNAA
jgi:DNA-binding response OmpR family regulator